MTSTLFRNVMIWDASHDEPVPAEVLTEGARIREVSDTPIKCVSARVVDGNGGVLMPGLIDGHIHATISEVDIRRLANISATMMTALAARELQKTLMRGFTTIRDCSGADRGLAEAVDMDLFPGPRISVCGRALTQTGGHGDFRLPLETYSDCNPATSLGHLSCIADGLTGVRVAARNELRRGADFVKVMVSGGVASPVDPIDNIQYSAGELISIVEEADAWNTYVAVHSYTSNSTIHALECGARTIEHGNLIDRDTAQMIAECDAFLVPTLAAYAVMDRLGEELGVPPVSLAKLQKVKDAGFEAIDYCQSEGAKIGFGSDLLGDLREYQSESLVLQAQVQSPCDVLVSATRVNAEILGRSDDLAAISPGYIADLILVDGNPLDNLDLLQHQGRHIKTIMKAGKLVKHT